MKNIGLSLLLIALYWPAFTQIDKITLEACYRLAQAKSTIHQEQGLQDQRLSVSLDQIEKDRLPSLNWASKAGFQSETIQLPFTSPGLDFELPLYSFQTFAEVKWLIYDGGLSSARSKVEQQNNLTAKQSMEAELYAIRDEVNRYAMGILLSRSQKEVQEQHLERLQTKLDLMEAGIQQGVVLPLSRDQIQLEMLRIQLSIAEQETNAQGFIAQLSDLIGQALSDSVEIEWPLLIQAFPSELDLQRPELQLFDAQKAQILANEALIEVAKKPKLSFYGQAGLGYPNPLNFFDDEISPFGVLSLKLDWPITDWKKSDRDRQLLSIQTQIVDTKKQQFEERILRAERYYQEQIAGLITRLNQDREIIRLQERIVAQFASQLEEGVLLPSDYLEQEQLLAQSQLNWSIHELQLKKLRLDYLHLMGAKD
ncbi:MAG TPA: TolC family protein [Saprospiraceae bacterium]|nr:TolC family protein [Saprospiraceae bacterium]HMQ84197.1 TolC family protein [Saprospiraceae bacterium]